MPGAQLMPQAAAPPPAPAPLPAGPPQGGPGGAAPPGPAGPAVSGPAAGSTGDVWVDSKKTLQSAARWVAQANPGRKWKPGELLDAVNEVIETMNGLNPMEKIAAQAQIAGAKAQHDWYTAETQRLSEQERETKDKTAHSDRLTALDAAAKRVKMQSDTKLKAVAAQDLMRMQVAELAQAGQDERQGKLLDFRQQALDAGLDEKTWQTLVQAGLKEQGMSDAFAGRVFSAQARSAGQATAPPTRQRVGAAPPPPKRGAAPTAGPKVDPVKEKAEALSHIRAGADPAQVRDIYKQRTGQPADF